MGKEKSQARYAMLCLSFAVGRRWPDRVGKEGRKRERSKNGKEVSCEGTSGFQRPLMARDVAAISHNRKASDLPSPVRGPSKSPQSPEKPRSPLCVSCLKG